MGTQPFTSDASALSWLPQEPAAPKNGASYAVSRAVNSWIGWSEISTPPPLTNFVDGWSFFAFSQIEDVLRTGGIHAACSLGPQAPTVAGAAFEPSSTNAVDTSVPAAGWAGTNWLIQRASDAPTPPSIGSNAPRTEVTPFADLPDPTFGGVSGVADLCRGSMRRNSYITISGLTVGQPYYYLAFFGSYPNSLTRATKIDPSDGGDSVIFGVDGVGDILSSGIRRYGFIASDTSISFLKSSPDTNGSYQNAFAVLFQGAFS